MKKPVREGCLLGSDSLSDRDVSLIRGLITHGSLAAAALDNGLSERHARRLIRSAIRRTGVKNRYALVTLLVLEGRISRADVERDALPDIAEDEPGHCAYPVPRGSDGISLRDI